MNYSEITLPSFDVNESEATITEILVKNKQMVENGQVLFSVENTKAVNEIFSSSEGYILLFCDTFSIKKTGDLLALIFESMDDLNLYISKNQKEEKTFTKISVNATKKAIELANKLEIDLQEVSKIKGENIIKIKDVQEFFELNHKKVENNLTNVFKYDRERVVIIGAGDGAEVVIDILRDDHDKEIVGLVDDNVKSLLNYSYPILDCGIHDFVDVISRDSYDTVIISIGSTLKSMQFRQRIYEEYKQSGIVFTNAISKSADIRRGVKIGTGNLVGAQSYIGTLTQIGDNNSISYATFIGHHNVVGSHNLIAPGFTSSGKVVIGDSCILPAGIVTRNCVTIGNKVILPVGYNVTNSIADNTVIQQRLSNGN